MTNNGVLAFNRTDTFAATNLISGSGSLVQNGTGTVALTAANSYSGNTTVSSGTLALVEPGSISASLLITVSNNATLDVISRADQTLTLNNGKALKGSGSVKGKLNAQAGSGLMPGDSIGTLTVQSNITLSGILVMELNRTNAQTSDRLASTTGTITAGGTLTVNNLGPALQPGDVFQLFSAPLTGFTTINLPNVTPNTWANKLGVNGTIQVVATNPTNITVQLTASNLTLNWPSDHLGWRLQAQTNDLSQGLGNNWVDIFETESTNQTILPLTPGNGSVFYRLVYP